MKETTKKFLSLLFNPGEEICWSYNQKATMGSPQDSVDEDACQLVAINPISGKRMDMNVTSHRSILVELDEGDLYEQFNYVKDKGMPFSACIFSGKKSLHFAITVDEDFFNYEIYRWTSEWVLNVMKKADQATKNPSRSIRFPGSIRKETGKVQSPIILGKRIKQEELYDWLKKFPDEEPKYESDFTKSEVKDFTLAGSWVWDILSQGALEGNRNRMYFAVSCEFYRAGYDLEDTYELISRHVEFENDFRPSELMSCIKSAFSYMNRKESFYG